MKKSSIDKRQFLLFSLQIIVQSIIFKKTVLLKKSIKSFVKIVHNYLLIKYEIVLFLSCCQVTGCQLKKIPCSYHHSLLILKVSQRLNIAASKSEGNITKKMKLN